MALRLNLGKYLEQHNISAYRLVQVSKLAPNTVYALARKPTKRIDLDTVSAVLAALETITGENVQLGDLIEDIDSQPRAINPKHEALLKFAKPPLTFESMRGMKLSAKKSEEFNVAIRQMRDRKDLDESGFTARERRLLDIMGDANE
jgi:DNA-binding Xre family transcriptional regulator